MNIKLLPSGILLSAYLLVSIGTTAQTKDTTRNKVSSDSTPKTKTLNEVKVNVIKPLVEQSDDKLVFNVENDPTSKSETAIDLLRKTPFVTVDGEDNIQVNGKSNFKVLLNGRETSMFARNIKEVLKGFPGSMISRIEVITNPSAKYDGEGVGGLINIITFKKIIGYNGSLSSFNRSSDDVTALSFNMNAKAGKIGTSIFYNIGRSWPVEQTSMTTTVPAIPTAYTRRVLSGGKTTGGTWQSGNAEFSLEVDSMNTISTYANINSWKGDEILQQTIQTDFSISTPSTSLFDLKKRDENPGVSIGSDYIRKFKQNKDKEFTIRFFGEFGKTESYLSSFQDNPGSDRYINNNNAAKNNQYTLQVDQVSPLKKNKRLDYGVKAIFRRASSDFESLIKYDPSGDFKMNPGNTDHFDYQQDVMSAYGMYGFKVKKTGFRIGGRVEHTEVSGDFTSSNTKVDQSYTTILPNIQATAKLGKAITMVLNYTKRLQRPFIWDLNPFVENNDSLNVSYGNPHLDAQIIHSVSAQTRIMKGQTFGGVTLEGSYCGNRIVDYSTFDVATGVTKTTSLNIGKEYQMSLNFNINSKITKKWSLFANASIRYSQLNNNVQSGESNSGLGGNFNLNNSYKFSNRFTISSYIGLWQTPATIQTKYPLNNWYNIALTHKFIRETLSVSLRSVNFFEKTRTYTTYLKDPNFATTNITEQIRRGFVLAVSYNFGKLTENVSRKKGVTNDDLLNKRSADAQ